VLRITKFKNHMVDCVLCLFSVVCDCGGNFPIASQIIYEASRMYRCNGNTTVQRKYNNLFYIHSVFDFHWHMGRFRKIQSSYLL